VKTNHIIKKAKICEYKPYNNKKREKEHGGYEWSPVL
jgi:hypothetical protein